MAGREPFRRDRLTAVLVYPNTVGRSYVVWLGHSLLQRLTERGLIEDGHVVEAPSTGCLDFQLVAGKHDEELIREGLPWERDTIGTGMSHPDMWKGIIVRDLADLEAKLARIARDPLDRPDRYSYRELRRFADAIRDRLKQFPTVGKIDEIGTQNEAIYLYYSSRRFNGLDLSPQTIAARLQRRNINLPGGRLETPQQTRRRAAQRRVQERAGTWRRADRRARRPSDVPPRPGRYRPRLRRPAGRDEFPLGEGRCRRSARSQTARRIDRGSVGRGRREARRCPKHAKLQTTRAVTLAVRQIKGTQIDAFARDVQAALDALKGVLPGDLQIERTHDEPAEVEEKIQQFDQNLIEAVIDRGPGGH